MAAQPVGLSWDTAAGVPLKRRVTLNPALALAAACQGANLPGTGGICTIFLGAIPTQSYCSPLVA
ncbi:MAG: hypothetical protein AMXMBFR61_21730 [Fimbriimonadales bacterium]